MHRAWVRHRRRLKAISLPRNRVRHQIWQGRGSSTKTKVTTADKKCKTRCAARVNQARPGAVAAERGESRGLDALAEGRAPAGE